MSDTKPVTNTFEGTKGKEMQGTFCQPELQKANQEIYRIEKVLRKRTRYDGLKKIYIKRKVYRSDVNSWIPAVDLLVK